MVYFVLLRGNNILPLFRSISYSKRLKSPGSIPNGYELFQSQAILSTLNRICPLHWKWFNDELRLVSLENNGLRFQIFSDLLPAPVNFGVSIGGAGSV